MEEKKMTTLNATELNDDELDQVIRGAINIYDGGDYHTTYWKYTCPACGISAVTNYWPECCNTCKGTNIAREEDLRVNISCTHQIKSTSTIGITLTAILPLSWSSLDLTTRPMIPGTPVFRF